MKLKFIIDQAYDKRWCKSKASRQALVDFYDRNSSYLKYSQKEYQKSWDEINNKFSKYVVKTTGYDWFYDNYFCVVSAKTSGASNWGTAPVVARGWKENAYSARRITAHELILAHYFEIYNHNFSKHNLTPEQVWALAEIAAFALTSLTEEVKQFWPWDNLGYYTNHNYPQLVKLQLALKDKFLKRKDFNDYIEAGIKLIKKHTDIKP